jgi:hypothetical protein
VSEQILNSDMPTQGLSWDELSVQQRLTIRSLFGMNDALEIHEHHFVRGPRSTAHYGKDGKWHETKFAHSHPGGSKPHGHPETVQVWADVDEGIADLVRYLNTIEGVTTHASCQGTIGDRGAEPHGPYVMASWADEDVFKKLQSEFNVRIAGASFGYVHPFRLEQSLFPREEKH